MPTALSSSAGTSGGGGGIVGAQDIVQHILAAHHDRGARGIAGNRQHAGLAQKAAALAGGQFHAAEIRAGHARDAVEFRQPLVQERIFGVEKSESGRFSRSTYSKNMRVSVFIASRSSGPHSGNLSGSGFTTSRLRISSHWPAKLSASADERRVRHHALHLRVQHGGIVQFAGFGQAQQFVVRHGTPQEVAEPRGQFEVRDAVHVLRHRWGWDRARCGTGNAATPAWLRWPVGCPARWSGRRDLASATNFISDATSALRYRAAVGAMRQVGDDLVHAGLPGFRIADQNLLAAGALHIGGKRPDEDDRIQKLVLLVAVGIFIGQRLDEIVVDEARAENVIALGQIQAHFGFRVRIEVDQLRRLGFDRHGLQQLAVHPEAERDRLGVGGALAGHAEADDVIAVPFHAMRWLRWC